MVALKLSSLQDLRVSIASCLHRDHVTHITHLLHTLLLGSLYLAFMIAL